MNRLLALLLLLLPVPALTQTLTTNNFGNFVASSPTGTQPFATSDYIPLVRGTTTFRVSASSLIGNMLPNASNAVLPDALNNLGLGTGNTPAFLGLSLNGLTLGSGHGNNQTNTVFGNAAGAAFTTGAFNTGIGNQALNATTTGSHNTALGDGAGNLLATQTGVNILGRCGGGLATDNTTYICDGSGTQQAQMTATSFTVPGSVSAGAVTASGTISGGAVTASGTISGGAVTTTGSLSAAGTISGGAISSSGNITSTNGQVESDGSSAALNFRARDNPASTWMWYATANIARLFNGTDKFTVDSNGTVSLHNLQIIGRTAMFEAAPTITSGGCAGGDQGITASNGTAAFRLHIGTGGSCANSISLTMPPAGTGWVCDAHNTSNPTAFAPEQSGSNPTSVGFQNYARATATPTTFSGGDTWEVKCLAF